MSTRILRLTFALLLSVMLIGARPGTGAEPPVPEEKPPHPRLFFGPEDVPRLRAKLGTERVGGPAGAALTALLNGKRHDASIAMLFTPGLKNPKTGRSHAYHAALIYDFQYPFMTEDERTRGRENLLTDAEAVRKRSTTSKVWYFTEYTNNWVISQMTDWAMQRVLIPGILFPDDPRAEGLRKQGLVLLRNYLQKPETAIEFIEESLTAVNGYGLYDLANISHTAMILARHKDLVDLDPYRHHDRLFYAEGRYRTYLYQSTASAKSEIYGCANGPRYNTGVYGVPLGGHGGYEAHPFVPWALLFLAGAYEEPVFAWLHLKASKREAWPVGGNFQGLHDLLFRGCVEPKSPQAADWPLSVHFPKAGVHIMRQNWNPDGSVVACHSGWGGSHYQPCQGQVVFTAQGYTILGKHAGGSVAKGAPKSGGYWVPGPGLFYTASPYANNILIVDGKSQPAFRALKGSQRKLGDMKQLGPDAVEMNPSAAYVRAGIDVDWKRTVCYDRTRDLVIIRDEVTGGQKELTFNWVTEGTVVDDHLYDMPGPYFMAAKVIESQGALRAKRVKHFDYWPSIQVSVPAGKTHILWAVGPGKELVQKALEEDHSKLGLEPDAPQRAVDAEARDTKPQEGRE
jgi:hypothetical protein